MRNFFIGYIGVGLLLFVGVLLFSVRGIDAQDQRLVEEALTIDGEEFWPDFDLHEYPIAVRDGEKEFVYQNEEFSKRPPVLPVMAATAYRVDGVVNVLIPSFDDMQELGSIVEGINDGYEMMFVKKILMSSENLSEEQYIGILFHEAMHAFQIKYYEEELFYSIPDDFEEQEVLLLIEKIDTLSGLKSLYEKEYRLLEKAVKDSQYIEDYLEARRVRTEALSDYFRASEVEKILYLEAYYEKVEGSARFLESQVVFDLGGVKLYNQYIESISEYADSKEKYYRSGMGICLLLEGVSSDWKNDVFSYDGSLMEFFLTKR